MFCRQCGAEIPEGAPFCGKCGASQATREKAVTQNTNHTAVKSGRSRYETRIEQVHPDDEMSTVQKFEAFGWEVANSQTIDTKDSHLEKGFGGSIVSVTEREKYVKLTFRRYLDHPNYARLAELEAKYDDSVNISYGPPSEKKWPKITGIICLVIGISPLTLFSMGIVSALLIAGGIGLLVWNRKLHKEYCKGLELWQSSDSSGAIERANLIEEAKTLL